MPSNKDLIAFVSSYLEYRNSENNGAPDKRAFVDVSVTQHPKVIRLINILVELEDLYFDFTLKDLDHFHKCVNHFKENTPETKVIGPPLTEEEKVTIYRKRGNPPKVEASENILDHFSDQELDDLGIVRR